MTWNIRNEDPKQQEKTYLFYAKSDEEMDSFRESK